MKGCGGELSWKVMGRWGWSGYPDPTGKQMSRGSQQDKGGIIDRQDRGRTGANLLSDGGEASVTFMLTTLEHSIVSASPELA